MISVLIHCIITVWPVHLCVHNGFREGKVCSKPHFQKVNMKKSRREKRWTVSTKYKAVLKQMLQMRGKFIGEQGQGS